MPTTRSSSRKVRPSVRKSTIKSDPENNSVLDTEADDASDSDQESLLQVQLNVFTRNVRKLEQDMKVLQKTNLQLRQELDAFKDGAPVSPRKRGVSANVGTVIKVQKLEARIKELEKNNVHLRKKLKKLQAKELKAEADELREGLEEDQLEEQDGVHKMRKLLRDFHEWMAVTTLAEDDDCPICFERLKPKKAYGLPCQHLICDECLPQIGKGSDETVRCPQCREAYPREDIEALVFTETERFDELLGLAAQWARIDHSGGDSSEEADEEEFIDDGETQSESSDHGANEIADEGDKGIEGEESEALTSPPSTPGSAHAAPYAESPTREKRKRMEELAQLRNQRRRVL